MECRLEGPTSNQTLAKTRFGSSVKILVSGPEIILISSEVATGAFAQFSKIVGGLTGMYVAYILAIGTFIRGMTSNLVTKIHTKIYPALGLNRLV